MILTLVYVQIARGSHREIVSLSLDDGTAICMELTVSDRETRNHSADFFQNGVFDLLHVIFSFFLKKKYCFLFSPHLCSFC